MRRAERLFSIVQLLRGGRPVTARRLAERLEVSERTIYRDVVELTLCGVPVSGEPGRGYTLPRTFEIPPLMFERHELDALVAGARMIEAWAGPGLAASARSALAKIRGAIPAELIPQLDGTAVIAPSVGRRPGLADFDVVHTAIGAARRLAIHYVDPNGERSERTIRPLALAYWGKVWTVPSWCELRADFRSFRLDRIAEAHLGEPFPVEPAISLDAFMQRLRMDDSAIL